MEASKPLWLIYAVDLAQIVSALFTAAAVIVAIWLARRNEAQRLRFSIRTLAYQRATELKATTYVTVTVVNAGILPVQFRETKFTGKSRSGMIFTMPAANIDRTPGAKTWPLTLQHGEHVELAVAVNATDQLWNQLDERIFFFRRSYFRVVTSLGRKYTVRLSAKDIDSLKIDWVRRSNLLVNTTNSA